MKIYIGFSTPVKSSWFSSLIKRVECRPYSHVYIRLQEPLDQEYMIFQSSGLYVNLFSIANFKVHARSLKEYEITITNSQFKVLWRFVKSMLGVPYSLKEDWGILLMKIFHLSKQPFNDGLKQAFCSELGAVVCELLDVPMTESASSIDPSALDRRLEELKITCVNNPEF